MPSAETNQQAERRGWVCCWAASTHCNIKQPVSITCSSCFPQPNASNPCCTMHLTVISKGAGVPLCISITGTCPTTTWISSCPSRNLVPGFQQWHGITSASSRALTHVDAVIWLQEMKDFPQAPDSRHGCPQAPDSRHGCLLVIRHGGSFWTSPTTALCMTESGSHSPHKSPGTTRRPHG